MSLFRRKLASISHAVTKVFAGFILFSVLFMGSAHAAEAIASDSYTAPDGTDLTAVAKCIPTQLSKGNLGRAWRESRNDFLEKVFDLKQDYDEYKLDETEVEFLDCLQRNGVTPQVKQNRA